MHDQRLQEMTKDHAHWSTEHGHWLKDVKVWRAQHEHIRAALRDLERMLTDFDELAEPLENETLLHEEEVKLHSHELAATPRSGHHAGDDLHDLGRARHVREQQAHAHLGVFHRDILDAVAKLGATYGPPSLTWRD